MVSESVSPRHKRSRLDAETDVIELQDGTLYAAQRPHMCFAASKDRGATWTVSRPMGFPVTAPISSARKTT